jgi:Kef-type K+ transport system membrane component KefB
VLLAGFLTGARAVVTLALVLAAGAGVAVGFALGQWDEAVGGGVGGALGSIGAAQLVSGTMRRGGSRFGTAIFIALAAVVLAAVAWIPVAGYLEATLVPALAVRLRGRAGERYAGLRSLAKD